MGWTLDTLTVSLAELEYALRHPLRLVDRLYGRDVPPRGVVVDHDPGDEDRIPCEMKRRRAARVIPMGGER